MAYLQTRVVGRDFQPVAVGTTETKALVRVRAGERCIAASIKILIGSQVGTATSTYKLGDGDTVDGYMAAANTVQVAGTLVDGGAGAFFASSGGKLYLADDTIDLVYTFAVPGNINPKCRVRVVLRREW